MVETHGKAGRGGRKGGGWGAQGGGVTGVGRLLLAGKVGVPGHAFDGIWYYYCIGICSTCITVQDVFVGIGVRRHCCVDGSTPATMGSLTYR